MRIYEFNNYKEYLNNWISIQPNGGHGILSKLAKELNVHTTLLSHTIRGEKDLTIEQAYSIGEFIGLGEDESDYFILLVQIERAGHHGLKNKLRKDLKKMKSKSQNIVTRVRTDMSLSTSEKAEFYSSWLYSAIRQLASIEQFQSRSALMGAFDIRRDELNRTLDFLIKTGLCVAADENVKIGPSNTHLEAQSPFVYNHHKNWRLKAIEKHNNMSNEDLMYTAPFTISNSDFGLLREKIIQFIEQFIKTADKTKNERLACLNIDLFFVK